MKKHVAKLLCGIAALTMALPAVAGAEEQIELSFSYWGSVQEKEIVEKALQGFEEAHPGVTVEPLYIANDEYNTKLTTMLAAGDLPDAGYMFGNTVWGWGEDGHILYLDEIFEEYEDLVSKEDLVNTIFFEETDGRILGAQPAVECFATFYNEDLVAAAGVEIPDKMDEAWSWDEWVEVWKKLTLDANGNNAASPDFDPENIVQYGVNFNLSETGIHTAMVCSNGGDMFDENRNYTLNSPEAVEALQAIADLIHVHHVMPPIAVSQTLPSSVVALQAKKVATAIDGQWILLDLAATEGLNYNVGVLPKWDKYQTMITGCMMCLFEGSEHKDLAVELYLWMLNPESVLELHTSGLWAPAQKDYYTDPELLALWTDNDAHPSGYVGAVAEPIITTEKNPPEHYVEKFGEVQTLVNTALDEAWLGNCTVQEALDSIDADVQAIMAE